MIQDFTKKSFVFVVQLNSLCALMNIIALMLERNIDIDEFHFHAVKNNPGRLMIHCQMEKDRIGRTKALLEKLTGVLLVDSMESKARL